MHLHIINPLDLLVQQTHNAPLLEHQTFREQNQTRKRSYYFNFNSSKTFILFFPFCFIFLPARILFVLVSRLHLLQTSPVVETLLSNHRAKPACIVGDVV